LIPSSPVEVGLTKPFDEMRRKKRQGRVFHQGMSFRIENRGEKVGPKRAANDMF
jgi:hypothetical protein